MSEQAYTNTRWLTPFRIGLMVGALPLIVAAVWVSVSPGGADLRPPRWNVEVVTQGEAVSRHGGVKVVVRDARGWALAQVCRGACDDVRLQTWSTDNEFQVSVFDAEGRSLADAAGLYVTNGGPVSRWTVAGEEALTIQRSLVDTKGGETRVAEPSVSAAPSAAAP
jgi:hypothetical protein